MKNAYLLLIIISIVFPQNFELVSKGLQSTSIQFQNDEIELVQEDGYSKITSTHDGILSEEGLPELPIYSTFFQMKPGIAYDVEYTVVSSRLIENINIYPHQLETQSSSNRALVKNIDFYNSDVSFPEKNLSLSEPMIMRDLEVGQITFVPYTYNPSEKTLIVYDEVEIEIVESGTRSVNQNLPAKRSKLFEPLYMDLIVDYEPLTSREEYQAETILYICGGNSYSHPYVQQLIEWREKQGYKVLIAPENETGSSTTSISSFIDNLYNSSENPPEIVGLIGDVDGTYGLATHGVHGGDGDNEYAYINGGDYLPEIFIGRISVNSSSDISNLINKTLTYEKAENQEDWWYERAALVGDPSSSGISTITTNQYIQYIMENFGMNDIRTNYSNGNYNNWVNNQFDDGILYYNYRGYIGSSGIGQSGLDTGIYTPFVSSITCGTGNFGWGTSESENWIRQGSLTNPQGAVAAVGVATSSTHTMYNNIVNTGIYASIFSFNIYNAGAALANGKLGLVKTYPTNSSAIGQFSQWTNLMGDPALHLWSDKPHDFVIDAPESLPADVQNMEVNITDENGNPVDDARVTLILGGQYFSAYTDQSGDAILTWTSSSNGDAIITAFKGGFRLAETNIQIGQVSGVAFNVDELNSSMDDSNFGNGNGELNPGELITLNLSLHNFGNENSDMVIAKLISGNNNVNVVNTEIEVGSIQSNESVNLVFEVELGENLYEGESLDFKLEVEHENQNHEFTIPSYINGPKLESSGFELVSNNSRFDNGEVVELDLLFHNSGSIDIENMQIELDNSNPMFTIIENDFSSFDINSGEQTVLSSIKLQLNNHFINGSVVSLGYIFESESGYAGEDVITFILGTREEGDPLGPDEHGYYIYDSGDVAYPIAPEYDWIELAGLNGIGESMNFNDGGYGESESGWNWQDMIHSHVVQLPFEFQFYGIIYNEVTVSSNGWISFGNHPMAAFRNYSIPGAGGPSPMVAPFWDDLTTHGSGQVYKYVSNDYVIFQWNEMRIESYGNTENTFQIIIYNPDYMGYVTPTGDGEMKVQYKEFNNISNGSGAYQHHPCYATIGIENHFGNVGLEYTFNHDYPVEAMEPSDETALFITTSLGYTFELGDLNQDSEVNVLDVVTEVNIILNVIEATAYQQYAGDMNDDNQINILDVVLLVNIILAG